MGRPKLIIKKILLLEVQIFILHYIYYLEKTSSFRGFKIRVQLPDLGDTKLGGYFKKCSKKIKNY